jgi:hypothetical protein
MHRLAYGLNIQKLLRRPNDSGEQYTKENLQSLQPNPHEVSTLFQTPQLQVHATSGIKSRGRSACVQRSMTLTVTITVQQKEIVPCQTRTGDLGITYAERSQGLMRPT